MTVGDLYNHLDGLIARLDPPADRELHYINYAHRIGDVLYHGTLSDLDGVVRATWTYEEDGEPVTRDRSLDRETFDWLWRSMSSLPVFHENLCNDMGRAIDPITHHVISLVFTQKGEFGRCVCLVPADESDKRFGVWIERLNRPDNPSE